VKHLILRLLVALLTFSAGWGLDRLLTSRPKQLERATPIVSYEPIAAEAVIVRPIPVSPPKPTLIFDYDTKKFEPLADYAFTGKRPKGLAWDDSFFIKYGIGTNHLATTFGFQFSMREGTLICGHPLRS
jgi:hypothetical protein